MRRAMFWIGSGFSAAPRANGLKAERTMPSFFASDTNAALQLLQVGEAKNQAPLNPVELAAGTVLAQALLNHDGAVMRR